MPGTGNTTVPTDPEAPASRSLSSSSSPSRLLSALIIAHSTHQPDRAGEVATFDPDDAAPSIVGREQPGAPPRAHFFQIRPGVTIDGGPLTGINISHDQFHITVEGDSLRVRNTGTARPLANGTEIPRGASVLLAPGSVLEVPGNCVLLVGQSPRSLPPLPASFLPLHPFGEPDRVGLVGESWRAHQLREDACFAASQGLHVLILGPSGSGKEVLARAIHALSARSRGPFVAANIASFTAELAALELFGSPKNYPNTGTPERLGYFGQGYGGTVLLDEIGEVLAALQAPLLRALDGAYNRVGDPVARPTGCVVILATNRDPQSIKHDVRYRLGVTVETPALADRRADIPLLVRALLRRRGLSVGVDASLIVGLLRSPLHGNVREVDNILTLAIAASKGKSLLSWPSRLSLPPPAPLAEAAPQEEAAREEEPPEQADPGRALLRETLMANSWHLKRTAKAMGLSIGQLYRLRLKYDLIWRN